MFFQKPLASICSFTVAIRCATSNGFEIWLFIPLCVLMRLSSSRALALSAMIGIAFASAQSMARMARVASYPFITGI